MIATLATYVIKSRQNEVVTWTAAGQSMYRLLFPCFALMLLFGFINWEIQERFLPAANRMQDSLRLQIRNQGILAAREGRNWIAIEDRIFSFEIPRTSEREENEGKIGDLTIYQFTEGGANLQSITKTTEARWENNKIKLNGQTERIVLNKDNQIFKEILPRETEISENFNPFKRIYRKPSHLSAHEISEFLKTAAAESERRSYTVALEKKYSTAFLPLIITLFTAPFALSLNRKGKVVVIGYAVGMWLLFMLTTSALEQFGVNGYVSPKMAVWSPLFLFTIIGVYLLTKIRT